MIKVEVEWRNGKWTETSRQTDQSKRIPDPDILNFSCCPEEFTVTMKDTRLLNHEDSFNDVSQAFESRKKKLKDTPQVFGIQYNKKSGEKYRSVKDGATAT